MLGHISPACQDVVFTPAESARVPDCKHSSEASNTQANIHSQGHSLKIPLDTASYKLYYVNYEIGLNCLACGLPVQVPPNPGIGSSLSHLTVFSSSSRWFAGFRIARTAQADADPLPQFAARSRTTSACYLPPSAWRWQCWLPQLPLPPGWSCTP